MTTNNPINAYFISPDRNDSIGQFTNGQIYSAFYGGLIPPTLDLDADDNELHEHFFGDCFYEGSINDVYAYFVHRVCDLHGLHPQQVFSSVDAWENYEQGMIDAIGLVARDYSDVHRAYVWDTTTSNEECEQFEAKIKDSLYECLSELEDREEEEDEDEDDDFPGVIEHRLNGELHREDGPAIIWPNGSEFWFLNGVEHREDGPAKTFTDSGAMMWFLNGELQRIEFNGQVTYRKECV